MSDNHLFILLQSALGTMMAICFFSSFLLRMRSEQIRSRKLLSGLMFVWGTIYFLVLLGILAGHGQSVSYERGVASPFSLLMGNLAVIVTTFYAVEVVRPGWLTWRRAVLWFVPFFTLAAGYFGGLYIAGQEIRHLPNLRAMEQYIGEFNVWYRCILLLVCFGYLGVMLYVFLRHSAGYRRWVVDHYVDDNEKMDISWIWIYFLGLFCMTVNYMVSILTGGRYTHLSHLAIVLVFFSYINYKGLFHVNPYPEGYFRGTMDEEKAEEQWEEHHPPVNVPMQEYKAVFEEWLRNEKPYLRPGFKLADVAEILPMNRSYLSRLFNEGYGMSFSQLIRQYRIEEAKQLIKNNPKMAQKQIALQSGFTSQEVFSRTFVTEVGKTPKQYAEGVMYI